MPGEVQLGHQGKLLLHKSENALEQAAQEVVKSTELFKVHGEAVFRNMG